MFSSGVGHVCDVPRWTLVLALGLGLGGCAKRTDARARQAFDGARGHGASERGPRSEVVAGAGGGVFEREKVGWERVAQMPGTAVSTMRASPNEGELAALATRWCSVQPEPRQTPDGPVRVCNPDPPLIVSGTAFSLELGGDGVIGLVATGLSSSDAKRVASEARLAAKRFCIEPWVRGVVVDIADPSFHTCAAEGGPLLAVSRFPRRPGSDRWLVSVAVLSPG
ncbi:MAG: hypothetical protein JKY37_06505 [Nannocystaceae bacterium]|nr:hypothetical protein [Nannocystaceae bacterium]